MEDREGMSNNQQPAKGICCRWGTHHDVALSLCGDRFGSCTMGYILTGDWRYGVFMGMAMGVAFSAVATVLGFRTPADKLPRISPRSSSELVMPDERRTQHATLGCGTLILIALIVLFFSRPGITDLEQGMHSLRSEVGDLKKAVASQTQEIKRLHDKLDQMRPGKAEEAKGMK